jgi:hypothetical protein
VAVTTKKLCIPQKELDEEIYFRVDQIIGFFVDPFKDGNQVKIFHKKGRRT